MQRTTRATVVPRKSHSAGFQLGSKLASFLKSPYQLLSLALIGLGFALGAVDLRGFVVMLVVLLPIVAVIRLLLTIRTEMREHTKYLRATADLAFLLTQRDLSRQEEEL